ncbi:cytochrome b-245 chaperone 1 isoform X1 [Kogia breviceps]|uniref:cytochrome b-245 chaperone 1 isoform X1 n=1 Tax=Kogia breviceps TaxID=27615 RepID=UPI0034D1D791
MGASKVSASRRHRRPGSQLSHPPPRVRKSAGLARSSGSRRPAGPEAWRSDFSPRPRSHPQPPSLLLKVVAARSRDVYAGGDTHQFLPPSEEGSRHQVLVPAGWNLVDWPGCCLLQWSLGWKLFYVTGCLFVAVQNLEDWEEAIFNKSTGKVVLKTFSLYRKLLTLCRAGHDQVVVLLSDIRDVNVEEEKVRYFGKGYVVVLRFATGFSHPLTQSAVMGHHSDVEAIAKLITTFLELHCLESPVELSQSSDSEVDGPEDQS